MSVDGPPIVEPSEDFQTTLMYPNIATSFEPIKTLSPVDAFSDPPSLSKSIQAEVGYGPEVVTSYPLYSAIILSGAVPKSPVESALGGRVGVPARTTSRSKGRKREVP